MRPTPRKSLLDVNYILVLGGLTMFSILPLIFRKQNVKASHFYSYFARVGFII